MTLDFNQTVDITNTSFTQTLASISTAATTTANSGGSTIDLTFSEDWHVGAGRRTFPVVTDYSNLEADVLYRGEWSINLDDSKFTLTPVGCEQYVDINNYDNVWRLLSTACGKRLFIMPKRLTSWLIVMEM